MREVVKTILECIGEDPDRPGLVDTPECYVKAMLCLTKGYEQNVRDIAKEAIFNVKHNEMVKSRILMSSAFVSTTCCCSRERCTSATSLTTGSFGLSKLPQIAEVFSRRLQFQENLTKEGANAIMEVLKPQDVAVIMKSSHLCYGNAGGGESDGSYHHELRAGLFWGGGEDEKGVSGSDRPQQVK
ncbi:tetrahydrobiopterin biosynthesis enzymes-like protein [Parathielavia appendiculata]|uniref:GTP cyclohydrolase 1 n=1 Tax=Parathielavia appendiculata TaxID=2587402 RepID=A0AAN6Z1X7_9PEZI|nr:tetrahydrobiopterin biosynthesis enzymes-like protein [Parathielavia appendiculata]